MIPQRPAPDGYDSNYQIAPHFMHTPGLTVISRSSPNYSINGRLQRQIGALYRKHGFEKCPNHGLFWAGSPRWTTIEDRTKTVLLVVELKEKDIQFWWKMDDEVRKILDEHALTERGVCVRYYMFWSDSIGGERRQHSDAGLHRLAFAADDVHGGNDELDELHATTRPRRFSSIFRNHPELEPQQDLLVGPGPTDATSQDEHNNTATLAEQFDPSILEDLPSLILHAEQQSLRLPLISQSANFGEVLHVEHSERRSSGLARRAFMHDYEQAAQARGQRSPRGWLDDVYWPARRSWA